MVGKVFLWWFRQCNSVGEVVGVVLGDAVGGGVVEVVGGGWWWLVVVTWVLCTELL